MKNFADSTPQGAPIDGALFDEGGKPGGVQIDIGLLKQPTYDRNFLA